MHVPESFDFKKVFKSDLAANPVSETEQENLKNTAYFILNALSRHKYDHIDLKKFEATGYLPLHAETMKESCGDRYRHALDVLLNEGVVEKSDKPFGVGVSRRYRLSKVMEQSPQVFKELGGTVRARYLKAKERRQKKALQSIRPLHHLTQWLDGSRLTVRELELHNFLELSLNQLKNLVDTSMYPAEVKEELLGRAALRMNHQLESVRRVLEGDFNPSNTGKDERLHSRLTNIKREIRSFLLYDGSPLVSLDIRSSQPYLLLKLLSKKVLQGEEKEMLSMRSLVSGSGFSNSPLPTLTPITHSGVYPHPDYYSITLPGASQLTDKQLIEESGFQKLRWDDGFYREFARKMTGSEPSASEVDQMKKSTMWVLFDPSPKKFKSDTFKALETHFPLIASVIRNIHGIGPKWLPLLLQRMEARILLYHVAKKISKQLPSAPLLTVHDCIMTTPEYADRVKAIMSDELTAIIGVVPGIKEELKTAEGEFADVEKSGRRQTGIDFSSTLVQAMPFRARL